MTINYNDIFKNIRSSIRLTDSSLPEDQSRRQTVLEKKS